MRLFHIQIAKKLERVAERSADLDRASTNFAAWIRERLVPLNE